MLTCTCPPTTPPFDTTIALNCPVHGADAAAAVADAIDHGRLIAAQPPGRCDLCGKVDETRPYGPNGEDVCFDCGMKDKAATRRAFHKRMGWDAP